ncbi:hypothetical protein J3R82DRAFT_4344 [Butyriboletus roseoflavus]|nr:hypothetical protein J3R82DRAFT_4344 [Butyriboletus roseoflavus]
MPPNVHKFLFSPPKDILPLTSRRVHLRRLYDVLHLSIQRGDLHRARRAWAILARCKEIDWRTSWMLAIGLLNRSGHRTESNQTKIDYLRTTMLHSPEDRESILCELVHLYVVAGRHREALDELELFELQAFRYKSLLTYLTSVLYPRFLTATMPCFISMRGYVLSLPLSLVPRARSMYNQSTARCLTELKSFSNVPSHSIRKTSSWIHC